MKIKFKRRNLREAIENWYDEAKEARRQRQLRKIEKLEKYHDAYAWYPMRLTTDDDTIEFAWFSKVRQKYYADRRENSFFMMYVVKKELKKRYTHKDFFKLKLSGEVVDDTSDDFTDMSHDGTNATVNVSGTAAGSKVYIKKADKDDHTAMWG